MQIVEEFECLYRSTSAASIHSVASKGTDGHGDSYNFVDANPLEGKIHYRVSQIDVDGTRTATTTEDVTVSCGISTVKVYPNPAKEFIEVIVMPKGENIVRVVNVMGQAVAEAISNNVEQLLNIANLPSGTYVIQVLNGNKVCSSSTILK